jgi:hypothetical protein
MTSKPNKCPECGTGPKSWGGALFLHTRGLCNSCWLKKEDES